MKKNILIIIALIVISNIVPFAQEGRPQYKIRNERAGVYIGDIIIELLPYVAPLQTAYFDSLITISFYDSLAWHRVVPNFVIQGGDPNSLHGPRNTWGEGDSSQANVPAEFSKVNQVRGIIGAARDTDINSANSQFYVNTVNNSSLTSNYTSYGIVVEGMDVVYDIEASPRDGNDNPLEKIEMFVTKIGLNESIPDVPALVEPADGYEGFTKGTNIVWTPDSLALLSFIEISKNAEFTDIVYADSFGVAVGKPDVSIKFSGAEIGLITYYWRVRGNNGARFSEYSDVRSFTTSIVAPELLFPEYASTGVVSNPLLDWEPVDGASSYRLQIVKTLPNFSDSRLLLDDSGIVDTEKQIEGLESSTRYYWRVLCETQNYDSPYSEIWLFTTEDVSGVNDEEIPTVHSLFQNYPNPFNPSTSIKFGLPEQGFVELRVYNILGQEVAKLVNKELAAGYHEVNFGSNNIATGMYIYRISVGNKFTAVKKMLMIK